MECGYDVITLHSAYVIVMLTSGLVVTSVTPTRVTDQPSHHQYFHHTRSSFHLVLLAGDVISLLTTMTAAFMTSSTSSYPFACQSILTSSAYRLVYVPLIVIYGAALLLVELTGHFRSAVFHPYVTSIFLTSPPWVFAAILVFSPADDFCVASQEFSIADIWETLGACALLTVAFCFMAVSLNYSQNTRSDLGVSSKFNLVVDAETSENTEGIRKDSPSSQKYSAEITTKASAAAILALESWLWGNEHQWVDVRSRCGTEVNIMLGKSALLRKKKHICHAKWERKWAIDF